MPGPIYVDEFTFPASAGFHTGTQVKGYARGGSVTSFIKGGKSVSPNMKNDKAAKQVLGEQKGTPRVSNGFAKGGLAGAYEKAAGTPKIGPGTHGEKSSGSAKAGAAVPAVKGKGKFANKGIKTKKMAMGGLARGTSPRKNAAIHAKNRKPGMGPAKKPNMGALMAALGGSGPPGGAAPQGGMGMAPGAAPSPGGPPMGAPPGPPMGGAPGAGMKRGGKTKGKK